MAKGYLEPALFNKEKNELLREAEILKSQKEALYRTINGGMSNAEEIEQLLKFASKSTMIDSFDEELFERFVDEIIVLSPTEIGFKMKCGLTLKERLVR